MKTIDYIVITLVVIAVLLVGWLSGRKTQNANDFLSADKSLNKFQAGLSMAATDFGGSGLVGAIGYCYIAGFGGIWWNLCAAPAFCLVGLFLAKKLNKIDGATVPDYLGKRYCPAAKYISCILHVVMNVTLLSTQFTISSAMLYTITGLDQKITLAISVLLVLFLTSGGLKAVVNTDATLFIIIVLSVAIATPLSLYKCGGFTALNSSLPAEFMSIGSIGYSEPLSWMVMCFISYATNQNYVQRMVSANNENTAKFSAMFTAGFYLVISIALGIIGVAAAVLIPGIKDTNTVFPELLIRCLPAGLAGLGVAGVFAATISTGTSLLHSITVLTVNDLWKPFMGDKTAKKNQLILSRTVTIAVAVISIIISLFFTNIIDVIYTASLFYGIAVIAPLILGIYSNRVTARGAIISIILSITSALLWQFVIIRIGAFGYTIPANVIGLIIGFISMLIFRKNNIKPHNATCN